MVRASCSSVSLLPPEKHQQSRAFKNLLVGFADIGKVSSSDSFQETFIGNTSAKPKVPSGRTDDWYCSSLN